MSGTKKSTALLTLGVISLLLTLVSIFMTTVPVLAQNEWLNYQQTFGLSTLFGGLAVVFFSWFSLSRPGGNPASEFSGILLGGVAATIGLFLLLFAS